LAELTRVPDRDHSPCGIDASDLVHVAIEKADAGKKLRNTVDLIVDYGGVAVTP
jgi:hypothetical protein